MAEFMLRNLPYSEILQTKWSPEVQISVRDAINKSPVLFNTDFVSRILGVQQWRIREAKMYRKPNEVV